MLCTIRMFQTPWKIISKYYCPVREPDIVDRDYFLSVHGFLGENPVNFTGVNIVEQPPFVYQTFSVKIYLKVFSFLFFFFALVAPSRGRKSTSWPGLN